MKIGELARRTHTNEPTIRYYEQISLLPRSRRHAGAQRTYDDEDVARLSFIRRCREFGFSIERIRDLLALKRDRNRSCTEARHIAQAHLDALRVKLSALRVLERGFRDLLIRCDASCARSPATDCVVLHDAVGSDLLTRPRPLRPSSHRRSRR